MYGVAHEPIDLVDAFWPPSTLGQIYVDGAWHLVDGYTPPIGLAAEEWPIVHGLLPLNQAPNQDRIAWFRGEDWEPDDCPF